MGRWTLHKLIGKGSKTIQIISAYRVSQKNNAWLLNSIHSTIQNTPDLDNTDPVPRNQLSLDLTTHIQEAIKNKEEIILVLDTNEDILPKGINDLKHSITMLIRDKSSRTCLKFSTRRRAM